MIKTLPLISLCVALLLCAGTAAAQDWLTLDPTDDRDNVALAVSRSLGRRPTVDSSYSDLRNRTSELPASSNVRGQDYTRSDIWQVANRSSGGSYPLFQGQVSASQQLPDTKRPWSSTYWPFQYCGLAFRSYGQEGLSPMELYDTYVMSVQGRNPGAAAWEGSSVAQTLMPGGASDFGRPQLVWRWKLGHNMAPWMVPGRQNLAQVPSGGGYGEREWQYVQVDWWGHCNGWAAAAILVPEPPERLTVSLSRPVTKCRLNVGGAANSPKEEALGPDSYELTRTNQRTLTFTGADLKGLYTEAYLSTAARMQNPNNPRFYGKEDGGHRYDPASGRSEQQLAQDFKDVLPHNFHRIMLDHLEREKGIVCDKDANEHVNNLPVVGWSYTQSLNREARAYDIRARVNYAYYTAPTFRGTKLATIDYTYRIFLDQRNRVVSSTWLGKSVQEHPDFIWVPDQPMSAPLKRNPSIRIEVLDQIVKSGQRG